MQDILAWQVERRGDFRPPGRLGIALLFHQLLTRKAQLHARESVDGVVNAAVIWNIAAGHAGVRRVDNGVAPERGNIALPEVEPRLHGRQLRNICDALCGGLVLQVCVLHFQKSLIGAPRCADIHQPAQELPLAFRLCRYFDIPVFRFLFQKRPDEKHPSFGLVHSFSTVFAGQCS